MPVPFCFLHMWGVHAYQHLGSKTTVEGDWLFDGTLYRSVLGPLPKVGCKMSDQILSFSSLISEVTLIWNFIP